MIDDLKGFLDALIKNEFFIPHPGCGEMHSCTTPRHFEGDLFCCQCGASRNHNVNYISGSETFRHGTTAETVEFDEFPLIYSATCLQCKSTAFLILYSGPNGLDFVVLRDTYGGVFTKNTPTEVKYYLDQAFRCKSVNALSASMTMYRAALEWILYEQGYTRGMLGAKISSLEQDIKNLKGPEWALQLNSDFLFSLKQLGNGAIHPNDGLIDLQQNFDKNLLSIVDVVFSELLDLIYEQPVRRKENLVLLQSYVQKFVK